MYEHATNELLAVWGPRIHLLPFRDSGYPGVFINYKVTDEHASIHVGDDIHSTETCRAEMDGQEQRKPTKKASLNTVDVATRLAEDEHSFPDIPSSGRLSNWLRQKRDFEIVLVYDSSFCAKHGGERKASSMVQIMHRQVEQLYRRTLVSVSLKEIKAFCNPETDPMKPPKDLETCPLGSTDCSRSSMILNQLRDYFRFRTDFRRRDALYLITGYDAGTSVVGAAYRGAVCNSDYAYGWMHGNDFVVLAHEMGHTLGAGHEERGVMQPYINKEERAFLSKTTVDAINDFITAVWDSWCLASWDRYYSYGGTTLVGLKMENELVEGSDVTFADLSGPGRSDLVLLHVGKRSNTDYLYFSIAEELEVDGGGRYRFKTWKGMYRVPGTSGAYLSGGGIAFGNIRSGKSKDLVFAHIAGRAKAYYQVGFGMDREGVAQNGWSKVHTIPGNIGHTVWCMGITIGDVRGKGNNDLVVVYVDIRNLVHYAFYVIAFNLGPDGLPRDGWSEKIPVPGWLGYSTGDISVALYDTTGSGKMDLVVHSNERALAIWRGSFRIGRDLDENGHVTGLWSTTIPAQGSPLISVMPKLTGGIAVSKVGRNNKPTTAILQSVTFPEDKSVVSYLELGFDLLAAAEAEVNVSSIKNVIRSPVGKCTECYQGPKSSSCKKRFEICSVTEHAFPLETVSMVMRHSVSFTDRMVTGGPDSETIFCEGFHDLFVISESDACRSDVGTEDVMSAGAAGIIQDAMMDEVKDDTLTVEYEIEFETREVNQWLVDEKDRNVGPLRTPQAVKVIIRNSKNIRQSALRNALKRLTLRRDFKNVFANTRTKRLRGGMSYIVYLPFNEAFQRDYFKQDQLKRVIG